MPDPLSAYTSVVDEQIRQARERGEFDDLPGMGEPLPGRGRPDDDQWWVRGLLERENLSSEPLLPTSMQLARQVERMPETVRDLPSEQQVRETVAELNRRIAAYLRAPSAPFVPVRPVDADRMVAEWRAHGRGSGTGRSAGRAPSPGRSPADGAAVAPVSGRSAGGGSAARWWRRATRRLRRTASR